MRRFVVIGQRASASADFRLNDLPSTSGRLDVLLRCMRAALLVSHGLRRDVVVYLVLLGGPNAPRSIRIEGASAQFIRPDERSLAILMQKVLANPTRNHSFAQVRPGIAIGAGIDAVMDDIGRVPIFALDERGRDIRSCEGDLRGAWFVGDHLGFDETTQRLLSDVAATPVSVGPMSIHADDAIAVVSNEMDRRRSE